jgi:hypothetical protein
MRAGLVPALVLVAAVAAACGGGDDGDGEAKDPATTSASQSPAPKPTPTGYAEPQRTHVSKADFCTAMSAWTATSTRPGGEAPDPAATVTFIAVGVPDDLSDNGLEGLKVLLNIAEHPPTGPGPDPLSKLNAMEQEEYLELLVYTDDCPGKPLSSG